MFLFSYELVFAPTTSRPVERGVVGVVVFRVYLVLRDTQGVADFTVSNGLRGL